MIRRLLNRTYDYCAQCGWWVSGCQHQGGQ